MHIMKYPKNNLSMNNIFSLLAAKPIKPDQIKYDKLRYFIDSHWQPHSYIFCKNSIQRFFPYQDQSPKSRNKSENQDNTLYKS